jgi:hypothetical protein
MEWDRQTPQLQQVSDELGAGREAVGGLGGVGFSAMTSSRRRGASKTNHHHRDTETRRNAKSKAGARRIRRTQRGLLARCGGELRTCRARGEQAKRIITTDTETRRNAKSKAENTEDTENTEGTAGAVRRQAENMPCRRGRSPGGPPGPRQTPSSGFPGLGKAQHCSLSEGLREFQ